MATGTGNISNLNPNIINVFTKDEVAASIKRMDTLLWQRYGADVIYVQGDPVGALSFYNNEARIDYRGSINRIMEVVSIGITPLSYYSEPGVNCLASTCQIHGNIYAKFLLFRDSLILQLKNFLNGHQRTLTNTPITLGGYSQGSMFAAMTAGHLITQGVPIENLRIVTFATLPLFDQMGVNNYNAVLKNRHLSFVVEEDAVAQNPTVYQRLKAPGSLISYHATKDPSYLQRLNNPNWTTVMPGAQLAIKMWYSKEQWEAHMLNTYAVSPSVLEEAQLKSTALVNNGYVIS